jgi:hypothetical protein
METVEVTILNPQAKKLLEGLEGLRLIKLEKTQKSKKKNRKFVSMKGLVVHIADDFDAPLEDFKDYM